MFSVESLILTSRYCHETRTCLRDLFDIPRTQTREQDHRIVSVPRGFPIDPCLPCSEQSCCGTEVMLWDPAKPEAHPCGLGGCESQREAELEGRNQVGMKDLEPHLKEG